MATGKKPKKGPGKPPGNPKPQMVKQTYIIDGKRVTKEVPLTPQLKAKIEREKKIEKDVRSVAHSMQREGESDLRQGFADRFGKSKDPERELSQEAQAARDKNRKKPPAKGNPDRSAAARKGWATRKAKKG